MTVKNVMKELPEIERIGFGVLADKDEHPYVFSHSDRFLIIDLKRRKEVIAREYRPNPYAEICKTKYQMPASPGDNTSEEELEIYRKIAEIVKDCKYVAGKNFGWHPMRALKSAGTDGMMIPVQPHEQIDSLIGARYIAGYRD
jgi:hypothetical protein